MQPSRDIARLVEIMAALRDPETGCPWDVAQSFDTIVPYTIEETFEVVDAIERRDADDLREELGDLLLQVVYYAQMAAETGLFDFGDVVDTVSRKMIRRHPHVFGDREARDARSAKGQWDRIKAEEKAERAVRVAERAASGIGGDWSGGPPPAVSSRLDKVPGALPAMMMSLKLQAAAAEVGFDWTEVPPILDKLREETLEFDGALASGDRARQSDELGDLLFCCVNLARRLEIDPEVALRGTARKFRTRFAAVERAIAAENREIGTVPLAEMEAHWQAAKAHERRPPS